MAPSAHLPPDALDTVKWFGEEPEPLLGGVIDELFASWLVSGRFRDLAKD